MDLRRAADNASRSSPPARITAAIRRSPAYAPSASPVSCANEVGTQIVVEAE